MRSGGREHYGIFQRLAGVGIIVLDGLGSMQALRAVDIPHRKIFILVSAQLVTQTSYEVFALRRGCFPCRFVENWWLHDSRPTSETASYRFRHCMR